MSDDFGKPIFLASVHAIAYWLSAKPKALDQSFEYGVVASSQNPYSPIPYLGSPMRFPEAIEVPDVLDAKLTSKEARQICKSIGGWQPIHLLADSDAAKTSTLTCARTHLPAAIPRKSYLKISSRLHVPVPELALLQIAPQLGVIEMTVLCSLFFGVFAFGPTGSGRIVHRRALCSKESVIDFLGSCSKSRQLPSGTLQLKKAVRLAADQCASPAEVNCALRLELPRSMGGYGLSGAKHNAPVSICGGSSDRATANRWCDWLWTTRGTKSVAAEYLSDEIHGDSASQRKDRNRNNELLGANVIPFSLGSEQLLSTSSMDTVASQISQSLGRGAIKDLSSSCTQREATRLEIARSLDLFKGLVA